MASDPHLDLHRVPYGLHGVKYIDLVCLGVFTGEKLPDDVSNDDDAEGEANDSSGMATTDKEDGSQILSGFPFHIPDEVILRTMTLWPASPAFGIVCIPTMPAPCLWGDMHTHHAMQYV